MERMTTRGQEKLRNTVGEIHARTRQLIGRLFKLGDLVCIDYASIFTSYLVEHEELCAAAVALGNQVAAKRGGVYRINPQSSQGWPSPIVRISEPAETELIGCVDVVPRDFEACRAVLLGAGYTERDRRFNGQDYTIIGVADPELNVAIYLPSRRLTGIMGIE